MRLAGKLALIIGGTRGIGRAICERFAEHGATVVVTGRNEPAGTQVAREIAAAGGDATYLRLDATDLDALKRIIDDVAARHGRLDVLVNNAGFALPRSLLESSVEDYDRLFDINVRAVFVAMKWGAEQMMATGGGSIINVSSTAATRAFPNRAIYCGTKGAVHQMTRSAALDVAGHGVRINTLSPGLVDTWLLRETRFGGRPDEDELVAELGASIPMGRIGAPADLAAGALFFASDESDWVTGANLVIDGGHAI